jgi:hypothetical protein
VLDAWCEDGDRAGSSVRRRHGGGDRFVLDLEHVGWRAPPRS